MNMDPYSYASVFSDRQKDDSLSGWEDCQYQGRALHSGHQTGVRGDEKILCK